VTVIQAKADGKVIASERIQAYRKDVRSLPERKWSLFDQRDALTLIL